MAKLLLVLFLAGCLFNISYSRLIPESSDLDPLDAANPATISEDGKVPELNPKDDSDSLSEVFKEPKKVVKRETPAGSAGSGGSTGSGGAAEPAGSAGSEGLAESAGTDAGAGGAAEPAGSGGSGGSAEPSGTDAGSGGAAEPAGSGGSGGSAESAEPAESGGSAEPTGSAGSGGSAEHAASAGSGASADTAGSAASEGSTEPAGSAGPSAPGGTLRSNNTNAPIVAAESDFQNTVNTIVNITDTVTQVARQLGDFSELVFGILETIGRFRRAALDVEEDPSDDGLASF